MLMARLSQKFMNKLTLRSLNTNDDGRLECIMNSLIDTFTIDKDILLTEKQYKILKEEK